MKNSEPIKAVCFDVFGTLISYGGQRTNPYRHLLASPGIQGRLPFLTRNAPIEQFAVEIERPHLIPTIRKELDAEIGNLQLFPEVAETLDRVRERNLKIAVCSNLAYEYGEAVRTLLPDMAAYVFSYEIGFAKPHPAIYREVCLALSLEPSEIFFTGDSKRCDVQGPIQFGMQAHWLDRRSRINLTDIFAVLGT